MDNKFGKKRIDGKGIAKKIRAGVQKEVEALKIKKGITPCLDVILVGDDPASKIYVGNKERACSEVGIVSRTHKISHNTNKKELIELIKKLNKDPLVHGILLQLPLPKQLDEREILAHIDPKKDVDGLHIENMGRLLKGENPLFLPCTPQGIMHLILSTGIEIKGKRAVVIGRSNIVGKPIALLLLQEHATVTICHSRTIDLPAVCSEADILVAAVGKAKMVKKDWIKDGAVVIDVGMNRLDTGLVGDVDFDDVEGKASYITPVPGGVGPMTIAMLLKNTLLAASR